MIAFVTFIRIYGIWIFLFCALGILFGIKMLYDARSLSRTTLFTMDQERAVEQTQRGLLLIAIMAAIVFLVTVVSVVIAPFVPQAESPVARGFTPTIANIFPTTAPTLTASPTVVKPTETVFATGTPLPAISLPTNTPPPSIVRPTQLFTGTVAASNLLPAPFPVYEKNKDPVYNGIAVTGDGEATTRNALIFKWDWTCPQCILGPNDKYVITISFTDKQSGLTKSFGGSSAQQKTLTMYDILRNYTDSGQFYQKAKDDSYYWYVQVKHSSGDQPLSLPSETWKFIWH